VHAELVHGEDATIIVESVAAGMALKDAIAGIRVR
jgi:hypothetical protein